MSDVKVTEWVSGPGQYVDKTYTFDELRSTFTKGDLVWELMDQVDQLTKDNAALRAKIKDHNDDCQAGCGIGDQEAVRCRYRSYFEATGRRCPTCPVYGIIEMDDAGPAGEEV